jgi:hypothetical protein
MTDRSAEHWYPTAAYLYVLHLDGPALAWEYLRRSRLPRDWLRRRRRPDTAQALGLRLLEDPALDARDAHPAWFPITMPWCSSTRTPTRRPKPCLRVLARPWPQATDPRRQAPGAGGALARLLPAARARAEPGRRHGLPLRHPRLRYALRAIARWRPSWTRWPCNGCRACGGGPLRPTHAAVLELHTLQALDATLAGASLREVAEGLFGADAVAADWHDSALRARCGGWYAGAMR